MALTSLWPMPAGLKIEVALAPSSWFDSCGSLGLVVLVVPGGLVGGVAQAALALYEGLVSLGVKSSILLLEAVSSEDQHRLHGIRYSSLGDQPGARRSILKLKEFFSTERPNHVIAFGAHVGAACVLAKAICWKHRPRIHTTEHGHWPSLKVFEPRKSQLTRPILSFLNGFADSIVCVSEGVAELYGASSRRPNSKVHVVPNAVNFQRIAKMAKLPRSVPLEMSVDREYVVYVGRLAREKRLDVLLDAFTEIASTPNLDLVVIGDGPERRSVETHAAKLGVAHRIHMLGHLSNPYPWMANAKCLVLSSDSESFAIVLLEALSLGVAVVSTDCPVGPAELLHGGKWGQLVAVGSPAALGRAIVVALTAKAHPETQRYLERYAPARVALQYVGIMDPST
jgi:glycosyltransferase involved in cell wall biosynthesis